MNRVAGYGGVLNLPSHRRGHASLFTDHRQASKKGHKIVVKNYGPTTQLTRLDLSILDSRIHGGATNLRKNTCFGNAVSKLGHELLHGPILDMSVIGTPAQTDAKRSRQPQGSLGLQATSDFNE